MSAADPVHAEFSRLAPQYDRRWADYLRATIRETLGRAQVQPGERVLDVGCGTGILLAALLDAVPGAQVHGVDPCGEMLDLARRRLPAARLEQATTEALPFSNHAFDLVLSTSAFHYFRQPGLALSEMLRVLRPGGRILITDWCHDYLTCQVCDFFLRHFNRAYHRAYKAAECQSLLEAADFQAVQVERYKVSWLWGMMTARGFRGAG